MTEIKWKKDKGSYYGAYPITSSSDGKATITHVPAVYGSPKRFDAVVECNDGHYEEDSFKSLKEAKEFCERIISQ